MGAFVHLPVFESALGNTQPLCQFLHRQILFQPLGSHMISEAGWIQMLVRLQPPTSRTSLSRHHYGADEKPTDAFGISFFAKTALLLRLARHWHEAH